MSAQYPIRIFIGATNSEWLPAKVLEFSILSRTTFSVITSRLNETNIDIPTPIKKQNRARTPFSFQRFLIPELCDYQGRAIYLDADMLLFNDINTLWTTNFEDADLLTVKSRDASRPPQFSVMLLNCDSLNWKVKSIVADLDNEKFTYSQLMSQMVIAKNPKNILPWTWNSLEYYSEGSINLLHYTDMNKQPWVSTNNPYKHLWLEYLRNAVANGFISIGDIRSQIEAGFVRPSLLLDINVGGNFPKTFMYKLKCYYCDRNFKPPYKMLKKGLIRRVINRFFN